MAYVKTLFPYERGCMELLDFREPVSAWSHCAGLLLALPGTLLLWRRGGTGYGKRLSLLVYGLSLAFCYSASTLYHGVRLPAARIDAFARLDSIGIFALIAGSYTPLAWCLMRGRRRRWTLGIVWGVAPRPQLSSPLAATSHRWSRPASTWGWGGASSSVMPKSRGWCRTVPCCPSPWVAYPIAWARCST